MDNRLQKIEKKLQKIEKKLQELDIFMDYLNKQILKNTDGINKFTNVLRKMKKRIIELEFILKNKFSYVSHSESTCF